MEVSVLGNEWVCGVCTLSNLPSYLVCDACGAERKSQTKPATTGSGPWVCECTYRNPAMHLQCAMCGRQKPSTQEVAVEEAPPDEPAVEAPPPPPLAEEAPPPAQAEELLRSKSAEEEAAAYRQQICENFGFEHVDEDLCVSADVNEMESSIRRHAAETMQKHIVFKCRLGKTNKLRKSSFPRSLPIRLGTIKEWVGEVHSIPLDDLYLEYRDSQTGVFISLTEDTFEACLAPALAQDALAVILKARKFEPEADGCEMEAGEAQVQSASPAAGILESAIVVNDPPPKAFMEAAECQQCGVQFGYVFSRRHHCRQCMKSFCDYCCNSYFPILGNDTPVRHCDECATGYIPSAEPPLEEAPQTKAAEAKAEEEAPAAGGWW